MDGPQNVIPGFAGYNTIPAKDQPENQAWMEDWEGDMAAMVALLLDPAKPFPERLNLDIYRWFRETIHPRNYMNMSYPELWLMAVTTYLDISERGDVTRADLTGQNGEIPIVSEQELQRAIEIRDQAMKQAVPGFGKPDSEGKFSSPEYKEEAVNKPKHSPGKAVETVLQASAGHTREYAYFRGKKGKVDTVYPVSVPSPDKGTGSGVYESEYPDINSRALQRYFIPVYSVRFESKDLWGADYVEPNTAVYADAWEPYLEPQGG